MAAGHHRLLASIVLALKLRPGTPTAWDQQPAVPAVLTRRSLQVDGDTRTYHVQLPGGAGAAGQWPPPPTSTAPASAAPSALAPVVLSFHGWCGTAEQQAASDNLRILAATAIVIHPEGFSDPTDPRGYKCVGGGNPLRGLGAGQD